MHRVKTTVLLLSFSSSSISSTSHFSLSYVFRRWSSSANNAGEIIKPSLNFKYMRDNTTVVADNIKQRKGGGDVRKVVTLYEQFRALNKECDELRAKRNAISLQSKKETDEGRRKSLIEEGKTVKEKLSTLEKEAVQLEEEMQHEALKIPNDTHPKVPIGPENNATILKYVNNQPTFDFAPKDHVELGEALGILDLESGSRSSGRKFYYMKHQGAMLEIALVQWAMQRIAARGYTPVITPDVVHHSLVEGCGFQPRGEGSQVYWLRDHDLCLVGTAEVSLAAMYAGKILEARELPIKMVGFSHCFRAETGGGSYNRGLYRVHQFSKVEMFVICTPEQSAAIHEEIRTIQESLYTELDLHFRVLDMPSEDLGASAYRKYDIEAWMPSRNTYGEITSASNCTDYQSRRLNIKYRLAAHDNHFVHTLNGTGCATSRVILTLLENYQQRDGSVVIPAPLRPFMAGLDRIVSNKKTNF